MNTRLHAQTVLILGLGASGLAMARWCTRLGAQVQVADTRSAPPQLDALRRDCPQAQFIAGPFSAALVEGSAVRAVFRSPGLAPAVIAPVWQAARRMGLWCGTELSLFAQALRELAEQQQYRPQVLAITGTNGKTTVTSLTAQLVQRAGRRVAVAGNIGPSLLDTLADCLDAQAAVSAAPETAQAAAPVPSTDSAPLPGLPARPDTPPAARAHPDRAEDRAAAAETVAAADTEDTAGPEDAEASAPAADRLANDSLPQVWVLELSSFQLDETEGFEPTAAVVLNLTQDHLDWHGDMAAYGAAKARIFGAQGLMVLNRDDPQVMAMLPPPQRVKLQRPQQRAHVQFGDGLPQRPGDFGLETVHGMSWLVRALEADETLKRRRDEAPEIHIQRLMPADALRIRGRHNALNALAALALVCAAGCPLAPVLYGLREYRGEPHRVELVTVLGDVAYIDDSKGTNVGATVAALAGLGAEQGLVVILGGEGKGQDFAPLAAPVARHARAVLLIGRDAALIRAALTGTGVPLHDAASLEQAVQQASQLARPGDAVLLSPACASLDMFDNYAHRARVFVAAVAALAQAQGQTLEASL